MFIARQLKEKNIAEYLLYMWQVEDIIRAHGADMDRLRTHYLNRFQQDEAQRAEQEQWYADLTEMMRSEDVLKSGHLQINKNVILWLTDLHVQLLQSPKFPFYTAAYYKVLPFIVELRNRGGNKELPELETCFDALYGVMLLKLQQKSVSNETERAVQDISKLLGLLADYYRQDKAGELKLE